MSNTEDTVQSMIGAALHADAPADIIAEIEAALGSEDRWVLNACILSIGHMARRFKTYPADLKARPPFPEAASAPCLHGELAQRPPERKTLQG